MKINKIIVVLCLSAMVGTVVSPVLAKGGRMGGGRLGGPSITRTTPHITPRQTEKAPRESVRPANEAAGQNAGRSIDQGVDPADYGRRSTRTEGTADAARQAGGQNQTGATRNQLTGSGGGFFGGFSFWPWLWFAGHGRAAADDGQEPAEAQDSGEEGLSDWLGQWWDGMMQSLRALFGM